MEGKDGNSSIILAEWKERRKLHYNFGGMEGKNGNPSIFLAEWKERMGTPVLFWRIWKERMRIPISFWWNWKERMRIPILFWWNWKERMGKTGEEGGASIHDICIKILLPISIQLQGRAKDRNQHRRRSRESWKLVRPVRVVKGLPVVPAAPLGEP